MGFMNLFGKGPLSDAKIDKIAKLAANPFAQPDVRMKEMSRLLMERTPAALRGVLKRFTTNASGHIADEDEKQWLEDELVEIGAPMLEPLRDYIAVEERLTYALRAYRRIAGDEAAVGYFIEVLRRYGPDDYRSAEAKAQLVWQLADFLGDARVLEALMPFLADHSDDVRWAVMDLLETAAKSGELSPTVASGAARELGKSVTVDEGRPRIQRRAAELLCEREWSISTDAEALVPLLEEEFFLDKKHYVRRRAKRPTTPAR